MSFEILMPSLSPTMTDGNLTKWLIKEGDKVSPGDVIAEIETDKATMEVEAVDEGTVKKLLFKEGTQSIKVNTPIAIIEDGSVENKTQDVEKKSDEKIFDQKERNITSIKTKVTEQKKTKSYENGNIISMREAIRNAIREEMKKNDKVFIIGEEVGEYQGAYKVTQGLLEEFGDKRVVDTPISEQGFTGLAIGSAFKGLRPIVEFMTFNFSMQAIDQIINSAAKSLYMSGGQINCPIVFRGPNGAASQVAAQHSQDFTSWYSHCPGLKVVTPSNAYNAKGLLKSAIDDDNPVIFLENEILYSYKSEVPIDTNFEIPLGKANIAQSGKDVTIVTYSIMVSKSLEAAKLIKEKHNIDIEIIDLQTIKPLDKDLIIESVKKTNRLLVVDEDVPGGASAYILQKIVEEQNAYNYLDSEPQTLTAKPHRPAYGKDGDYLSKPSTEDVFEKVYAIMHEVNPAKFPSIY